MMNSNGKWKISLFVALIIVIFFISFQRYEKKETTVSVEKYPDFFQPQREMIDDTEIYWQKPKKPKGILLLFHGCTHSGLDFFTLPEEKIIIRRALEQSIAVISFTSLNRETGCWQSFWPVQTNHDVTGVQKAFERWAEKHKLSPLPKFAFGASSGGLFVSLIWHVIPLHVAVIQISYAKEESLLETDESKVKEVIYSVMKKDNLILDTVKSQELSVKKTVHELDQLDAYATFFSDRIENFSEQLSIKSFKKLLELNVFEHRNSKYYMIKNPRRDHFLLKLNIPHEYMEPMKEELQLLHGFHELSSQKSEEWIKIMKSYCE